MNATVRARELDHAGPRAGVKRATPVLVLGR
jgi:hypothetical protein